MQVHWYPGHMAKAKKTLQEQIKLVDLVIDVRDARIPISSSNPDLQNLIGDKKSIIVLNKFDLADSNINKQWLEYYKQNSKIAVKVNSVRKDGINILIKELNNLSDLKNEKLKVKGILFRPLRAMIVGIPNVGKSSLINALIKKNAAKTGNKPGVTRGKQWVKVLKNLELLDTPGLLWPKFDNEQIGLNLAVTGAISDQVFDLLEVALKLLQFLAKDYAQNLIDRYKLSEISEDKYELLAEIAKKRGFLSHGGNVEYEKVALVVLHEYRQGKLGTITLEKPII